MSHRACPQGSKLPQAAAYHYYHLNNEEVLKELTSIAATRNWIHCIVKEKTKSADQDMTQLSAHVRNAILYIKSHYVDSELTVETIAAEIGISSSRLGVLFKQEMSVPVSEYLTTVRINAAISLLQNSNLKIYEIANQVGYHSSQYFSRTFLNVTGKKPLDYRKNSLAKYTLGEN